MFEIKGKHTTATVFTDDVDSQCVGQLTKIVNNASFKGKIAGMPDIHAGKGCVVGFTMPLGDRVVPNIVGVDVNCGVFGVNIGSVDPFRKVSHQKFDDLVRQRIPFGMNTHDTPVIDMKKEFPWDVATETARKFSMAYRERFGVLPLDPPEYAYDWFEKKCKQIGVRKGVSYAVNSLGTLGGGNHYIEVAQSNVTRDFWIIVHSGSRNFGGRVCTFWQDIAVAKGKMSIPKEEYAARMKEITTNTLPKTDIPHKLEELRMSAKAQDVEKELEYLSGEDMMGYFYDMIFTQTYADVNKLLMLDILVKVFGIKAINETIRTSHNYIDFRDFIIRKGAISSYENERMIIPFNMRDGSLLCVGKTNPDWNYSAPHGAGRIMSRREAKEKIKMESFEIAMRGIFTTSVTEGTLDEAPQAYKNAEEIERLIEPTALVLERLRVIHNMKDTGGDNHAHWSKKKEKHRLAKEKRDLGKRKMEERELTGG